MAPIADQAGSFHANARQGRGKVRPISHCCSSCTPHHAVRLALVLACQNKQACVYGPSPFVQERGEKRQGT